jgi:hypothetical protein
MVCSVKRGSVALGQRLTFAEAQSRRATHGLRSRLRGSARERPSINPLRLILPFVPGPAQGLRKWTCRTRVVGIGV